MKTLKRAEIFNLLDQVAPFIPAPLYWLDTNIIVIGANELCLEATGRSDPLDIFVGKSFYEFHPKDIADELVKNTRKVIDTGKILKLEEWIKDFATGRKKCFETIRAPLFDFNKNVVGVICTAIDISDSKEAEQLRIEKEKNKAVEKEQQRYKEFMAQVRKQMASFEHLLNHFKIDDLNSQLGNQSSQTKYPKNTYIKLSKREREVLYCLSLNKSPKEIAVILSAKDNKPVSPATIQAIINKQLYLKFNTGSVSQLLQKATLLELIPFTLENAI